MTTELWSMVVLSTATEDQCKQVYSGIQNFASSYDVFGVWISSEEFQDQAEAISRYNELAAKVASVPFGCKLELNLTYTTFNKSSEGHLS